MFHHRPRDVIPLFTGPGIFIPLITGVDKALMIGAIYLILEADGSISVGG